MFGWRPEVRAEHGVSSTHANGRPPPRSTRGTVMLAFTFALAGCAGRAPSGVTDARHADVASVAPAAARPASLPVGTFRAPSPWKPSFGDGAAVQPPDVAKETWRAFVNQAEPMQKQTPTWQAVPAKEVVTLAMPKDSRFRCFVNPLEILPETNDYGTKLEAWLLKRELVCSSDDFATWTSYPHRVLLSPDGQREVTLEAEALLREQGQGGEQRATYVLFRSDQESREASPGGPRVLPGVPVAD